MIASPFIRKLEHFAPLSTEDQRRIEALIGRATFLAPHEHFVRPGDDPRSVHIVLDGWACRYKTLPDGRRQIVSLFLPGDMCDPYVFLLDAVDYAIGALTPCTVAKVPARSIRELTADRPDIAEALWWQTLVEMDLQREKIVSLGRRNAKERIAHLFCEVLARLAAVGWSNGTDCDWPLTQADLADITGLSSVHVNRSLQEMRNDGLVELHNRRLVVRDHGRLRETAMFDTTHLHGLVAEAPRTPPTEPG